MTASNVGKYYNLDRDSSLSANSDYYIPSQKAVKTALNTKQDTLTAGANIVIDGNTISAVVESNVLKFEDVSVTVDTFVADETYDSYPFKANIRLTGVTDTMFPTVIFSVSDALSGNYLFVVETYNGGVTIWSKSVPESTLVIPTIVCQ